MDVDTAGTLFGITLVAAVIAAWLTHIIWAISTLASGGAQMGQMVLAGIGAFMPPVGIIHGILIWFGAGM